MVERRLKWLARIVVVWGAVIFCQLISLQVIHHQQYVAMARARQLHALEIPAPRGAILDRNGQPLALSTPVISIYVNPQKVPDLGVAADILAGELKLDEARLYGDMKEAYDNGRGYLIVQKRAEYANTTGLRNLKLDWINFQQESQRHYPNGALAAHVLGGVDFEEKGNAGIEKALDADLRGQPGKLVMLTDVKRQGIESQVVSEARPGISVTLTIDERVQFIAERELAAAVEAKSAVSGSIVVMDPRTGDILAMASYPTYDPNVPLQPGQPVANRQNHAVAVPFEPGSVFKVITLSAALETTSLRPESPINCHGGVLKIPGRVIHDSHLGYGVMPMEMVLAKSSNIGAIEVGFQVGQENMAAYVRKFGFGQKTGISLPGESKGKVREIKRQGSLASVSMGQEVSVTTLQLAQAGAVIANGGLMVRPRLVMKKGDMIVPPAAPLRAIRGETAITMRQLMEGVVLRGTGTAARIQGYSVGGKTGSAQIFNFKEHHYTHTYNGSFVGFAPIANPSIVVVVTLNGTHGTAGFGGAAAAPVFKTVAAEALRVLDVPKDVPDPTPLVAEAAADVSDLADADTDSPEPNILVDEGQDEDAPPAQAFIGPLLPAQPVQPAPRDPLPAAPNFIGKNMRAVLAEATAQGFAVTPDGSGIARDQHPRPGAAVHKGERIRVRFTR